MPVSSGKSNIIGITGAELERYCVEGGYKAFHGRQIFQWLYDKLVTSFDDMTDLPASLRKKLAEDFFIKCLVPEEQKVSRREDAVKYGFRLDADAGIEAVVLFDSNRRTSFCISSQVGCPVGCAFCATGRMGLVRNLAASEIMAEVLCLVKLHGKPASILFMGMGEPLLNYDEVVKAIEFFSLLEIGNRKVTVSTCGIVKGITRLAASGLKVKLALSLGSAVEVKRRKLIPAAKTNSLDELKKAIIDYRYKTSRRVSIEYTVIDGVNDGEEDIAALAGFAKTTNTHVNLIRFNRVEGSRLRPPLRDRVDRFKEALGSAGVPVSERFRRGDDIRGACGQLVYPFVNGGPVHGGLLNRGSISGDRPEEAAIPPKVPPLRKPPPREKPQKAGSPPKRADRSGKVGSRRTPRHEGVNRAKGASRGTSRGSRRADPRKKKKNSL